MNSSICFQFEARQTKNSGNSIKLFFRYFEIAAGHFSLRNVCSKTMEHNFWQNLITFGKFFHFGRELLLLFGLAGELWKVL